MDNIGSYNPWYYYIGNELVKKKKPFAPGDHIHLHSYDGCYKVYEAKLKHFSIIKNRNIVYLPWTEFRCRKGEGTSDESKLKRIVNNINEIKNNLDLLKLSIYRLIL